MLASIILGIAAGACTPYAEAHAKTALESVVLSDAPLTPIELRMVTFAALLFVAAILAGIVGDGSAVAVTFGGVLGVFAPRIIEMLQKRKAPDYSEDDE
jgi:hypothetical protein